MTTPRFKYIPLTQGYRTKVDAEDYAELAQHRWCVHMIKGRPYAVRNVSLGGGQGTTLQMARVIMQPGDGLMVDHRYGRTLDNRRSQLRVCTNSQNNRNSRKSGRRKVTSKYKGVCFVTQKRKWGAYIGWMGSSRCIGQFRDQKDAALAYNVAAQLLFGEYALLNDV